jgi:thiamine pyrophosphate-dependent acetolactate synthase large subunit-like protein
MFEETRHPGRRIGVDLKNSEFESLAAAYGMPFYRILKKGDLQNALSDALTLQGPSLIEIDSPISI